MLMRSSIVQLTLQGAATASLLQCHIVPNPISERGAGVVEVRRQALHQAPRLRLYLRVLREQAPRGVCGVLHVALGCAVWVIAAVAAAATIADDIAVKGESDGSVGSGVGVCRGQRVYLEALHVA
jgi:hypothetical protein